MKNLESFCLNHIKTIKVFTLYDGNIKWYVNGKLYRKDIEIINSFNIPYTVSPKLFPGNPEPGLSIEFFISE